MSADEHVTDLIPGYVLECLDEDEALQVSRHLATCPACQAELQVYQAVVDSLVLATPETAPPEPLKQRLMARIQAEGAATAESRPASAAPSPPASRWEQMMARLQQVLAAPRWQPVMLLLIVGLIFSNVLLWQRATQAERQLLTTFQTVPLAGTEYAPQATGVIIVSADGEHGTLVVDDLPKLDETQQYQLWLIRDGQRTSGGVFSVSADGYHALWVRAPRPLIDYPAFGVTIEPAGGSPGPTGAKVLGGEF